jgi:TonB family protein
MGFKGSLVKIISIVLLAVSSQAVAAESVAVPKTAQAVYAPKPKYPVFALMRHEEGAGIFVFRVEIKSGLVKKVIVARSTGHKDLDAAALKAFNEWKFQPGAVASIKHIFPKSEDPLASTDGLVKVPIDFTIR